MNVHNVYLEKLEPFIRRSTWHTGHQNDLKHFYNGVARSFELIENQFQTSEVRAALSELVDKYHPNFDQTAKEEEITELAEAASTISEFLLLHD